MSSDHNTKPTLIMTGSGSDDCQVTSDPSNLDYKTTEEIAKEYGGKENVMHKSVPKGSCTYIRRFRDSLRSKLNDDSGR